MFSLVYFVCDENIKSKQFTFSFSSIPKKQVWEEHGAAMEDTKVFFENLPGKRTGKEGCSIVEPQKGTDSFLSSLLVQES